MAEKQGETGYHVIIRGTVQGVGFRPFVYREAQRFGIRGTVRNRGGEVLIHACGRAFSEFVESIKQNKPPHSFIESVCITPAGACEADGFSIADGQDSLDGQRFFPPDIAMCGSCASEVFQPGDRRHGHYFNTCTACGPRFSILRAFPYSRDNTAMRGLPLCDSCRAEYRTPGGARFHAETVSCPGCGPSLFYKRGGSLFKGDAAFREAMADLPRGIAVKGVGGYHLACSPYDAGAVRHLRALKGRERKPFAIMFRDVETAARVCEITQSEESLLLSPARPIVLLKMKNNPFAPGVLGGANNRCGCFLPYTPLQALILRDTPCLIMTSANKSSAPIITGEPEIFALTDRVLYHDREITRCVEDSVLQSVSGKPYFIRRARGYTPSPILIENNNGAPLLAVGGDLKAAFGLLNGRNFTLSQMFGDLADFETFKRYQDGIADFEGLFAIAPNLIARDAHPRYFSSALAETLAAQRGVPVVKVFHHHAHIASVMAEHRLKRVLGAAMDGAGYGDDGNIWGGEFLICEGANCRRAGHLANVKLLGGDNAAVDAAKTAACYLHALGLPQTHPDVQIIGAALGNNVNTFLTSSMGRLFDAIAAVTGVCSENGYEGECAVRLQYAAENELRDGIPPLPMEFSLTVENGARVFGWRGIFEQCLTGRGLRGAALGFHTAISDMILQMCIQTREEEGINSVALSGGVFQNALLLELTTKRLAASGFEVYTNQAVPCGDGGLALGQAYVGGMI